MHACAWEPGDPLGRLRFRVLETSVTALVCMSRRNTSFEPLRSSGVRLIESLTNSTNRPSPLIAASGGVPSPPEYAPFSDTVCIAPVSRSLRYQSNRPLPSLIQKLVASVPTST